MVETESGGSGYAQSSLRCDLAQARTSLTKRAPVSDGMVRYDCVGHHFGTVVD